MASPTARQAMVQVDTSPWSARKRGADLNFDTDFSEGLVYAWPDILLIQCVCVCVCACMSLHP